MKLFNTLLVFSTIFAWGTHAGRGGYHRGKCLSRAEAESIIDRSIIWLEREDTAFTNQTGQGLFAETIVEYSDGYNLLRSQPFGSLVFPTKKQDFIAANLALPGIPEITTLYLAVDCRRLVWFKQFNGVGNGKYRIRGVTFIDVDANGQIAGLFVSFNSLAYAINLGFTVTSPSGVQL